jgi:hypothetical protein
MKPDKKRYISDVILRDGSRAVECTKGRSGHAARDEAPRQKHYPVQGPCAVSIETGGYVSSSVLS